MTSTPISEEVNDDDHVTSDQVATEPRRSTRVRSALEWYGNPILEVMLLDLQNRITVPLSCGTYSG